MLEEDEIKFRECAREQEMWGSSEWHVLRSPRSQVKHELTNKVLQWWDQQLDQGHGKSWQAETVAWRRERRHDRVRQPVLRDKNYGTNMILKAEKKRVNKKIAF